MTLDPITIQVIESALRSICEEMGAGAHPRRLFHEHQGEAGLLHSAV